MVQVGDRSGSAAAGFLCAFLFLGATAQAWQVELVSRVHPSQISETAAGAPAPLPPFSSNLPSPPSLSADGRYVVFESPATNLVPGQKDSNTIPEGDGGWDVFLTDLATGTTTLVSHSMASPQTTGNASSGGAVLSADGRWVAFTSRATDLAPGQSGSFSFENSDLFLYDRVSGTTTLVAQSPREDDAFFSRLALSADGRYLAFVSDASGLVPGQVTSPGSWDVFLYDRVEGTFRLVSHVSSSLTTPGDRRSDEPSLSSDGRYVAFRSMASDLVPGTVFSENVFLYDRISQSVRLVGEMNEFAFSADGRYAVVAAWSVTYLWDRETGVRTVLSEEAGIISGPTEVKVVAISADGRYAVFGASDDHLVPGQQESNSAGLFLYDRISRAFTLVSRNQGSPTVPAEAGAPSISGDGRFVAFMSAAEVVPGQTGAYYEWEVFLFDRASGTTRLLSSARGSSSATGNFSSYMPAVSADGSVAAFWSDASDLLPDLEDTNQGRDLFVAETASGERSAVSVRAPDLPSLSPGSSSTASSVSADGRWVAFESFSPSLVSGQVDANGTTDVFLYDRATKATVLVSRRAGSATTAGDGRSVHPLVNADGRYVAFESDARNLVNGSPQANDSVDVFLFDRTTGTTRLVGRTWLSGVEGELYLEKQISPDGRWVAFASNASDVVPGQQDNQDGSSNAFDVFLWDRVSGSTILVSRSTAGPAVTGNNESSIPALSADGRFVVFQSTATDLVPGQIDEDWSRDLFLFDRRTSRTSLVSHAAGSAVTAAGSREVPSISADGRFIAYTSFSDQLVPGRDRGLYLYDRNLGTNEWISPGTSARLSADGRTVALVDNESLYLWSRTTRTLTPVDRRPSGEPSFGNVGDYSFAISADGRFVAYSSRATDLVPGEVPAPGHDGEDIYLFDRLSRTNVLVSRAPASPLTAAGFSEGPVLSASGRHVAFTSDAALVSDDLNLRTDAYLFTLAAPVSVPACTLFDTRRRQDRPALRSGVRKVVKAHGACTVPATAKSVVVKVTVVNPTGKGNVRFYPGDSTTASAGILRFERGKTRSGNFTIPLAANGTGTFAILPQVASNGTVHAAVEVSGYIE